jgi:uncharacterized protein (DUF2147 family)
MQRFLSIAMALTCLSLSASVGAQMTPLGTWRNVDDKTGEAKAEIQIVEQGGVLSGRIVRTLRNDPNARKQCDECRDDRKGQPIVGLEIIRGVRQEGGDNLWAGGGKILDPENGKEYTVRLVPLDGGQSLQVRGYIGPFYRTQLWQRIP